MECKIKIGEHLFDSAREAKEYIERQADVIAKKYDTLQVPGFSKKEVLDYLLWESLYGKRKGGLAERLDYHRQCQARQYECAFLPDERMFYKHPVEGDISWGSVRRLFPQAVESDDEYMVRVENGVLYVNPRRIGTLSKLKAAVEEMIYRSVKRRGIIHKYSEDLLLQTQGRRALKAAGIDAPLDDRFFHRHFAEDDIKSLKSDDGKSIKKVYRDGDDIVILFDGDKEVRFHRDNPLSGVIIDSDGNKKPFPIKEDASFIHAAVPIEDRTIEDGYQTSGGIIQEGQYFDVQFENNVLTPLPLGDTLSKGTFQAVVPSFWERLKEAVGKVIQVYEQDGLLHVVGTVGRVAVKKGIYPVVVNGMQQPPVFIGQKDINMENVSKGVLYIHDTHGDIKGDSVMEKVMITDSSLRGEGMLLQADSVRISHSKIEDVHLIAKDIQLQHLYDSRLQANGKRVVLEGAYNTSLETDAENLIVRHGDRLYVTGSRIEELFVENVGELVLDVSHIGQLQVRYVKDVFFNSNSVVKELVVDHGQVRARGVLTAMQADVQEGVIEQLRMLPVVHEQIPKEEKTFKAKGFLSSLLTGEINLEEQWFLLENLPFLPKELIGEETLAIAKAFFLQVPKSISGTFSLSGNYLKEEVLGYNTSFTVNVSMKGETGKKWFSHKNAGMDAFLEDTIRVLEVDGVQFAGYFCPGTDVFLSVMCR